MYWSWGTEVMYRDNSIVNRHIVSVDTIHYSAQMTGTILHTHTTILATAGRARSPLWAAGGVRGCWTAAATRRGTSGPSCGRCSTRTSGRTSCSRNSLKKLYLDIFWRTLFSVHLRECPSSAQCAFQSSADIALQWPKLNAFQITRQAIGFIFVVVPTDTVN